MELQIYKAISQVPNIHADYISELVYDFLKPRIYVYNVRNKNIIARNDSQVYDKLKESLVLEDSALKSINDPIVEISSFDEQEMRTVIDYIEEKLKWLKNEIANLGGRMQITYPGTRISNYFVEEFYYDYHCKLLRLKLEIITCEKKLLRNLEDLENII